VCGAVSLVGSSFAAVDAMLRRHFFAKEGVQVPAGQGCRGVVAAQDDLLGSASWTKTKWLLLKIPRAWAYALLCPSGVVVVVSGPPFPLSGTQSQGERTAQWWRRGDGICPP